MPLSRPEPVPADRPAARLPGRRVLASWLLACFPALPVLAQTREPLPEVQSSSPGGPINVRPEELTPNQGLWDRANLLGDLGGLRGRLAERGITLSLQETAEVLGNPTGGVRRGLVFEGLAQLGLGIDTGKAVGFPGGTINVSAFQIHGRGLSQNALNNNLHTVSSIEAERGFLLFEFWYEQALLNDRLAIRIGQLSADQEFLISKYAQLFTNHTFGWPTFPSTNLPSGGPNYPLATPGVRVRVKPAENWTALLGVFNGDPAGPGTGTPQSRDRSGTNFRLRDDVFVIGELQHNVNAGPDAAGLPGTYRLGAYYHGGRFTDQRRNAEGLTLADPLSADLVPRNRRHDYAVYVVADQQVHRTGTEGGIGVFARVMGGPGDRNLLNVYADAGVTWKGLVPGRTDDTVGFGIAVARISDTASKLDSDVNALTGAAAPVRRHETALELTYQAQLAPWWQVQPAAQYVLNPGGGVNDPARPGKRVGDAAVFTLRTAISF